MATLVAVLGLASSSQSQLLAQIDALGTNLLTVTPGSAASGQSTAFPSTAPGMIARIGPVTSDAALAQLNEEVYRNPRIPVVNGQAITVAAAGTGLPATVQAHLWAGRFLTAATDTLPAVVLGHDAAAALGVDRADGQVTVWLGDRGFDVIGILDPVTLAPELDRSALIGFPAAHAILHREAPPTTVYVRTAPSEVDAVAGVLGATADPAAPQDVTVADPVDALVARGDASAAFDSLFFALGAVALLVGAIGIANVMVISVLERRGEIGLRRAMGARRTHIGYQFVSEAAVTSVCGGFGGAVLGALAVTVYSSTRHWNTMLAPDVLAGAVALALCLGALGGLYPAWRATRLSPAEALRSP